LVCSIGNFISKRNFEQMKKAVIQTGGKQYLVHEGETIEVELIKDAGKTAEFDALMVIDGDSFQIGTPTVKAKVSADVVEADIQGDKVTSIRFKAKKRVRKVRGHRQHHSVLKIKKIAA
jgi:large subunit ribosomal protein L21